jgi:hypothetical protein
VNSSATKVEKLVSLSFDFETHFSEVKVNFISAQNIHVRSVFVTLCCSVANETIFLKLIPCAFCHSNNYDIFIKWRLLTILSAVISEKLKGKAIHGRKKKMGNYDAALEYSGFSSWQKLSLFYLEIK